MKELTIQEHSPFTVFLRALGYAVRFPGYSTEKGRKRNVYKAVFLLGAVSVGFPNDSAVKNLPANWKNQYCQNGYTTQSNL